MSIPESQLEIWAKQGATQGSKNLHESIRLAIKLYNNWSTPVNLPEIYLQGSYKNDTNIYGDSDVDVVVQSNATCYYDAESLPEIQKSILQSAYSPATYDWDSYRTDILTALRSRFGQSSVIVGDNCLIVQDNSSRLTADVLVCFQHRKYLRFLGTNNQNYIEGVEFYSYDGNRWVTNYPKAHYDNGVQKNSPAATYGRFKSTVRIFKNARTYLINKNAITSEIAPSYFLQCLLYNVPNNLFISSYNQTFFNILNWFHETDISRCICQNGQTDLFGNTPEQWSLESAQKLKTAFIDLWNNW